MPTAMQNVGNHPRVLFLINSLAVGGAERVFVSDANELARRGWEVHFATLFGGGPIRDELALSPERIYDLAARSAFDLSAQERLHTIIKSNHIDAVYSTLNEANAFARRALKNVPQVRLYTREANTKATKGLRYRWLDIWEGKRSTKIVCVSKAVRDSFLSYAPSLGSRCVVLYNGVDIPAAPAERPASDQIRLLSVGSFTQKKDHEVLLCAFALLPSSYSLTLIGDGVLRPRLENLANELDIETRVHFLGALPFVKVAELYATSDVFVLPSRTEGCPNVVSEAQAYALPVVAFDIPGMREFVSEQSGLVVRNRSARSLADGILEALERRNVMGAHGYEEVAKDRSREMHLQALEQLFR